MKILATAGKDGASGKEKEAEEEKDEAEEEDEQDVLGGLHRVCGLQSAKKNFGRGLVYGEQKKETQVRQTNIIFYFDSFDILQFLYLYDILHFQE